MERFCLYGIVVQETGHTKSRLREGIGFNAHIPVFVTQIGGRQMKESKSSRVSSDAMKAIRFSEKAQNGIKYVGGNKLTHQACSYGMALKWLIYTRKMTYEQFGKLYNGTTGQNINHLINRCAKERFFEEDLEKMCGVLNITMEYLEELCGYIDKYWGK